MVVSCSAINCRERHQKDGPYTFHRFPHEQLKRTAWLKALNRENFIPSKSSRLCSRHFTPDSFFKSPQGKHKLKVNAIPTIFDEKPIKKPRKVRKDKNMKKPHRCKPKVNGVKKPRKKRSASHSNEMTAILKEKPFPDENCTEVIYDCEAGSEKKYIESDSDSCGPMYIDMDADFSDSDISSSIRLKNSETRFDDSHNASSTFDEITNTTLNKPCKKRLKKHRIENDENSDKTDLLKGKPSSLEDLANVCQVVVGAWEESEKDLISDSENSVDKSISDPTKKSGNKSLPEKTVDKRKSRRKGSDKFYGEFFDKQSEESSSFSDDSEALTICEITDKPKRGRKKKVVEKIILRRKSNKETEDFSLDHHSSKKGKNSQKSENDLEVVPLIEGTVVSASPPKISHDVYTQTGAEASDAYPVFETVKELKKFIQHKRISYFGDCVPKFDNPQISKRNWEIATKTVKNCKLEKRRAVDKLRRTAVQLERLKESNEVLKKKTDMYERLIKSITEGCCKCNCHNILECFTATGTIETTTANTTVAANTEDCRNCLIWPVLRRVSAKTLVAGGYLGYAACIMHCISEYFGDVVVCQGPSMEPTLYSYDVVLTEHLSVIRKKIKRGDIIIARSPCNPKEYICKRVKGMPGDKIRRGLVTHMVPLGHVWLEGDNKNNSCDSRTYGPVPIGLLRSRAMCRVFPFGKTRMFSEGYKL